MLAGLSIFGPFLLSRIFRTTLCNLLLLVLLQGFVKIMAVMPFADGLISGMASNEGHGRLNRRW